MRIMQYTLLALSLMALAAVPGFGQGKGKGKGKGTPPPMSFFITSSGPGNGANLGGLAGADAHCQELAEAAGSTGMTWRALLSTQGPNAVNARDRIGEGPWRNANGQVIANNLGQLFGDTIEEARIGNFLHKLTGLDENGNMHNGVGDQPNQHDIITGSQPDGRAFPDDGMDHTCNNYTSEAADGSVQLGHFDRLGGGPSPFAAHPSRGCSQENLVATGGNGNFYCFGIPNQ